MLGEKNSRRQAFIGWREIAPSASRRCDPHPDQFKRRQSLTIVLRFMCFECEVWAYFKGLRKALSRQCQNSIFEE